MHSQDSFPSLSLSQIYGAIAWYLDHQAEAEEYFKERQAEANTVRQEIESQPDYAEFRETIRQRRAQFARWYSLRDKGYGHVSSLLKRIVSHLELGDLFAGMCRASPAVLKSDHANHHW